MLMIKSPSLVCVILNPTRTLSIIAPPGMPAMAKDEVLPPAPYGILRLTLPEETVAEPDVVTEVELTARIEFLAHRLAGRVNNWSGR